MQFLKVLASDFDFFCSRRFQQRNEGPFLKTKTTYEVQAGCVNIKCVVWPRTIFTTSHIIFFSNGLNAKFLIFSKTRELKKKGNLRIVEYSENTSSPIPVKCASCNLQREIKILTRKTYRRWLPEFQVGEHWTVEEIEDKKSWSLCLKKKGL